MAMVGAQAQVEAAGGIFAQGSGDPTHPDGPVFGPGTVGRWMLIEWAAAAVWLVVVWRVVDGY